jgi:prevent-host-death family protein
VAAGGAQSQAPDAGRIYRLRVFPPGRTAMGLRGDEMTRRDYVMVMNTLPDLRVSVSVLKAKLSEYLRSVRQGQAVLVCDRDTPVARLVPYRSAGQTLSVRPPLRPLHSTPLPPPLGVPTNSLEVLLEERHSGR